MHLRWSGFGQSEGRNKVYWDCDVMPSGQSNPLLVTASRYAETLVALIWTAGGWSCGACGREARECGRGGGQRGCVVHGIVHTARRARAGPKDSSTNPQDSLPCPSRGSWAALRSAHRATALVRTGGLHAARSQRWAERHTRPEVAAALGIKNKSSFDGHRTALMKKGWIELHPGSPRNICLP